MTKLSKIAIAVFIVTFIGQIAVCNLMSVKTKELNQISAQLTELQNDISVVNQQIYLASSIASLEDQAKNQGFLATQVSVKAITKPVIARVF